MSVFDDIKKIPEGKLASDMGEKFTAIVLSASKHKGEYGESLKLELQTGDGATFSTTYRIPKKITGKGQLDMLIRHCEKLNLHLADMIGKTFVWQRKNLEGPMQGNPRHYPVKLVKEKL